MRWCQTFQSTIHDMHKNSCVDYRCGASIRSILMTPLIYRKLAYSAQKHLRSELIFLIFFYVDRNAKTIEQENKWSHVISIVSRQASLRRMTSPAYLYMTKTYVCCSDFKSRWAIAPATSALSAATCHIHSRHDIHNSSAALPSLSHALLFAVPSA